MSTFNLKVGDRLPTLRRTLRDGDGDPIDLTGATVTFRMRPQPTGPTVPALKIAAGATTTIGAPTDGVVDFAWGASDSDTPGVFDGEFAVSIGGLPMTVPSSGYVTVVIEPKLT